MSLINLFLVLVFAVGLVSSVPGLLNGNSTAWNRPEFLARHLAFYNEIKDGEIKFDPALVINAMKNRSLDLKIITSHRGVHGPSCPENTICAVDATIAAGIESVEIDVRTDMDGTLWPIHDQRIGRVTNYRFRNQPPFNPYTDSVNSPSNPMITDIPTAVLSKLQTRDNNQKVCSDFVDLETVLQHIKSNGHLAVILDVKSKEAILQSAKMIQKLGMSATAAIKFWNNLFDPYNKTDMALLDGINFIPLQAAGTQDFIASKGPWWKSVYKRVTDYDNQYLKYKNLVYSELNCKMWDYWGPFGWLETGPSAFAIDNFWLSSYTLGVFIPTPDVDQGYFNIDGKCCVQINDFLTKTKYFGTETRDDRTKVDAMVATNDVLTSDDVFELYQYLYHYGYRKGINKILQGS